VENLPVPSISRWFVDDITPLLWLIAFAELLLMIVAAATQRGRYVVAMVLLGLCVPLLILLDWFVVTDRERVEDVIDDLATAVENEDVAGIARHLAQECHYGRFNRAAILALAQRAFDRYEIEWLRIRRLRVRVSEGSRLAVADFTAVGVARDQNGTSGWQPTRWRLALREIEPDRWMVTAIVRLPELPGQAAPRPIPGLPQP